MECCMPERQEVSEYVETAFNGDNIGPLPPSPKNRVRIGNELQPIGCYAGVDPYHQILEGIEALQDNAKDDPGFKNEFWW